jgi:hypothetical protein
MRFHGKHFVCKPFNGKISDLISVRSGLLLMLLIGTIAAHAQHVRHSDRVRPCPRNSHLYQFDRNAHPRDFTEKLGSHPQFPFLQEINGVNTPTLFIASIRDTVRQQKYRREFNAFDALLHNSGFTKGYKDLDESAVKNAYIPMGTIGNLGFYNPQKDLMSYNFVVLEPGGETPQGVAAWKLTNKAGCFLYILHTCGNAFYPIDSANGIPNDGNHGGGHNSGGHNDGNHGGGKHDGGSCCKTLSVDSRVDTIEWKQAPKDRPLHVQVNFYEGILVPSAKHKRSSPSNPSNASYDTVFRLIRHLDTLGTLPYGPLKQWKVYGFELSDKITVCRDSSLKLFTRLLVDSSGSQRDNPEEILFVVSDTSYNRHYVAGAPPTCTKKWEIAIDGGFSFNSIPRFNSPLVHTQTSGAHVAAEFAISRILSHWFQIGLKASYITLSYQDDVAYPGTLPGTYNLVNLGRPIIPVQLFGKATIGGPLGWQSNATLSVGYSVPTNGNIENDFNTLSTQPQVKGGPTAGIRLGLAYFFSCKFGLAVSAGGQYFSNASALQNYHLWAMPVLAGIRYRF